jgi:membrane protease YdiL (CAAX protease family)
VSSKYAVHRRLTSGRRDLVAFLALTFAVSWVGGFAWIMTVSDWSARHGAWASAYVPNVVVCMGPALAATVVTWTSGGRAAARTLFRRLRPVPGHWPWYLGIPTGAVLSTCASYACAGVPLQALAGTVSGHGALHLATHFGAQFVVTGIGEELGWRGWLLPHFARTRTLAGATFLAVVAWEAWHIPKFASDPDVAAVLALQLAAAGVILSLLWVHLKGNVFVLALAHASLNAPILFVEHALPFAPGQLVAGWRYLTIVYLAVALAGALCLHRRWADLGMRT